MSRNIPPKIKLIIGLFILIAIIIIVPINDILMNPSITGAVTFTRLYVKGLQQNHTCEIPIFDGWNLISTPCLPSNTSLSHVLSGIDGHYTSIHYYDADDSADHWKSYNPTLPSWTSQDLNSIDEKRGYWIYANSDDSLTIVGTLVSPDEITLKSGWNLVGYPSLNTTNISSALNTIEGSYTVIWLYNSSDGKYYYYGQNSGTLDKMHPYYGYWINATQDDTLFII